MEVSIIVIGDELLIGQVTDTNSGDIARMISPVGWTVRNVAVVHDDSDAIRNAIEQALSDTDIVLITGGLGPTKDDITKATLCSIFGGGLHLDEGVLANVENIFRRRGLQMNELTRSQAMVPDMCRVIPNDLGTAPVMWFERDGKVLVAMPGVPFETRHAFSQHVLPALLEHFPGRSVVEHRTFIVVNISESDLAGMLDGWEEALPRGFHLAYLPQAGYIRLRIDAVGENRNSLVADLNRLSSSLSAIIGDRIIASEDLAPEEILMRLLKEKGLTMGTAESCTGGNIAHRMTMLPGVSDVFSGGIVSYSNEVKIRALGVSNETLMAYGAVSEPTAREMAEGARHILNCDVAVATSGIAGPGGGTPDKPVGTVCIAIATPETTMCDTLHLPGNRSRVIDRATTTVLVRLILALR
ncbi:MAG: CinA family nicotinamide mononucleotide deamidase-related protein [Bacteroidales bacterium]|nr:CinA family nicotinamide mononucleotide deamidase-related protein [Bacteroidales bacterium]